MSDNNDGTTVWGYSAILDAAVYSVLTEDKSLETDEFAARVWDVFQVIQRRVAESPDNVLAAPSDHGEASVREDAAPLADGFEDDDRRAEAKKMYEAVPRGGRRNRFEDRTGYWERDDFDPYGMK